MPVIIFAICYALFVMLPRRRALVACIGAVAMILIGAVGPGEAITKQIHWNVIGLFFGMLILAELFMESKMPAVMAEALVRRTHTTGMAMLAICAMASFLSMFAENVAVVLVVAPVAFSLAKKLKISPVTLLICIAVSSNLQGTATLIGDPPSMILAGYMKLNFNEFFIYQGKLGIFFAVQVGAIASLAVVTWLMRKHKGTMTEITQEKARSLTPTILLIALILGLSMTSVFDPDFKWLAGTITMLTAGIGLIWYRRIVHWGSVRSMFKRLDWDTTFFLIGIFVLVGGLSDSGWLDKLAEWMGVHLGGNLLTTYISLIFIAVIVSAFVDNVPFLIAMIPVVQQLADTINAPVPLLMFGLLIGACLGGNITPVGASANIVTVGLLRKYGHVVSFREFMSVGIPFTVVAVLTSSLFVWWIWAP